MFYSKTNSKTNLNIALGFSILASSFLMSCSSAPKTTEYEVDKVVARMDDMSARPSWAKESKFVFNEDNSWVILGVVEVPGDSRVQAAFKMSDANARGNLSQKIETSILKIVETSDTGLGLEDQSLKSLIREISQTSLKNVDIDDRYWEKVARTTSSGERILVMKVFSKLKISKFDFIKTTAAQVEKSKSAPTDVKNKVESLIEKNLADQFGQDATL